MGDNSMARAYQHLRLDMPTCLGLREVIRPGVHDEDDSARQVEVFCRRLYLAMYALEADPDLETIDFAIQSSEVMIINNFVSAEDGDWAKDVLHQTRQVLYELTTGREAVRLASSADSKLVLDGVSLDPDIDPLEVHDEEPRTILTVGPDDQIIHVHPLDDEEADSEPESEEPKGVGTE